MSIQHGHLKNQSRTTKENKDEWQTPDSVYQFYHKRYNFQIDLAASRQNSKCSRFISKEDNALLQDWNRIAGNSMPVWAWCNPPYSRAGGGLEKWLKKAWMESQNGVGSVFLINGFEGDSRWQWVAGGKASRVTHIIGRIPFIGESGVLVNGNTMGSIVVEFAPYPYSGRTTVTDWCMRDDLFPGLRELRVQQIEQNMRRIKERASKSIQIDS